MVVIWQAARVRCRGSVADRAGLNPQWEVAGGEGKKKVIAAVARQWVVGGQVGRRRWSGLWTRGGGDRRKKSVREGRREVGKELMRLIDSQTRVIPNNALHLRPMRPISWQSKDLLAAQLARETGPYRPSLEDFLMIPLKKTKKSEPPIKDPSIYGYIC